MNDTTAVPGVSRTMAQSLVDAPGTADIDELVQIMGRHMQRGNTLAGEYGADMKRMGQILDGLNAVLPTARTIGTNLLAMSDAEKAMAVGDQVKQIAEVISGYRASLMTGGFSAQTAEQMSMHMHAMMMQKAMGATTA